MFRAHSVDRYKKNKLPISTPKTKLLNTDRSINKTFGKK